MNRKILAALPLALAAVILASCSTPQVQIACQDTAVITQAAQPFLIAASPEVKTAVMLLGAGAVTCGTPEYAAARDKVLGFLVEHGVRVPGK